MWAALQNRTETLYKELLVAKKKSQEILLCSVLQNEGRCWTECYTYVKRGKGNRENIASISDQEGKLVTDPIVKARSLKLYYASLF